MQCVQSLGNNQTWSMDDLFPCVLYVVYRAQVQRLGAECALVDEAQLAQLMDGETQHMFTTLQAAYYHIVSSARKYL